MKGNTRKILIALVVVIVLAFIVMRGDQLRELSDTMSRGSMIPLILAVGTQFGKYIAQSFGYSFSFKAVNEYIRPRNTLPLVFGTFFMNTVAPSLNLAGTTLVVNDARKRGIEPGKATSAALLMQITIDSAFTIIMFLGFTILAFAGSIAPGWFLLGLIVVVLVGAMVTIMILGRKRPSAVIRVLRPVERFVNRVRSIFKKPAMKPWVETTVAGFSDAAGLIMQNPRSTFSAFGCSIFASICELSCFALVSVAFGVTNPAAIVCGYVVATLFAMVSFTPQGVGVVEAAVLVAFTSFGESSAAGMAIGLVNRGIVFWMPFLIGAILINTTKTFQGTDVEAISETSRPWHMEEGAPMNVRRMSVQRHMRQNIPKVEEREQGARWHRADASVRSRSRSGERQDTGSFAAVSAAASKPEDLGESELAGAVAHARHAKKLENMPTAAAPERPNQVRFIPAIQYHQDDTVSDVAQDTLKKSKGEHADDSQDRVLSESSSDTAETKDASKNRDDLGSESGPWAESIQDAEDSQSEEEISNA
ncbi:MAG: lysylphosphatidylglycerol synthase transmembrane domain-containing protein [Eggerthellaceae bacterium]